jgi:hypothetical protein
LRGSAEEYGSCLWGQMCSVFLPGGREHSPSLGWRRESEKEESPRRRQCHGDPELSRFCLNEVRASSFLDRHALTLCTRIPNRSARPGRHEHTKACASTGRVSPKLATPPLLPPALRAPPSPRSPAAATNASAVRRQRAAHP